MTENSLSRGTDEDDLLCITNEENVILIITLHTSEPMQTESRKIRIYIKAKDKRKKEISITILADFFQHLQNVLYQVCDEIEENEFRKTGRYPKALIEHCEH